MSYESASSNTTLTNNPSCPRCIEGFLVIRENKINNQQFIGCSNYPQCSYTLKDTRVIADQVVCPNCEGYMVIRKSARGEFYGCSNYPLCSRTIDPNKVTLKEKNNLSKNQT